MTLIEFKNNGYDPQIDYLKGLCILFVIWTHALNRSELNHILFPYWGDTAVPLFLIIQVFHYFKNGNAVRMPSAFKLWRRILRPFIIMIIVMFMVQYLIYYDITDGLFTPSLYWDKRGPGSYYIFIFIEFAFIIPLLAPLIKKLSNRWALFFFVTFSQLLESISCITQCPDNIYRILFFRYTFLIFIGYLLATKKLELNKLTFCASGIGIITLYLFNYTNIDLEPLFYTSLSNWKYCHWICYFYIAYLFLWFLKYIYIKTNKSIINYLVIIGKYSYEIYLFQIFYYATCSMYVNYFLNAITNYYIHRLLFVLISITVCVVLTITVKSVINNKCSQAN